jgi:uncharacterized protein (UPF0333 family)
MNLTGKLTYRQKIELSFSLLVTVPIALLVYLALSYTVEQNKDSLGISARQLADTYIELLDGRMTDSVGRLRRA